MEKIWFMAWLTHNVFGATNMIIETGTECCKYGLTQKANAAVFSIKTKQNNVCREQDTILSQGNKNVTFTFCTVFIKYHAKGRSETLKSVFVFLMNTKVR